MHIAGSLKIERQYKSMMRSILQIILLKHCFCSSGKQ